MGLTQLDIIRKQIESAAKNRIAGETAGLRRKTSLIGEVSRLTGRANRTLDQAAQQASGRRRRRRGPAQEEVDPPAPRPAEPEEQVLPDGYVRRSPVQPIYTPPDYWRRLARRAAGITAMVLLALAVLWVLLRYSVLSI